MLKLLCSTYGRPFYQQHSGLFVVVLYLLFGMIQGYQLIEFHHALLISICSSPLNLLFVYLFWLLYTLKAVVFIRGKYHTSPYQFTVALLSLARFKQITSWALVYTFLLCPVLVYAGFMSFVSIKGGYYSSFLSTICLLAVLMSGAAAYTFYFSNYGFKPRMKWFRLPVFNQQRAFWTWPIFYLVQQQTITLAVCKIVSLLFFKAMLWVFADVGDDLRVYLTALLAVVLSHAVLIANLSKFDAISLAFLKVLPIAPLRKLVHWAVVFVILLLPELGMFSWLRHFHFASLIQGVAFVIASLLFLHLLFYVLNGDMERYFKSLLFFFFLAMIAVLGGYDLWFSLLLLAIETIYYLFFYHRFDLKKISNGTS